MVSLRTFCAALMVIEDFECEVLRLFELRTLESRHIEETRVFLYPKNVAARDSAAKDAAGA